MIKDIFLPEVLFNKRLIAKTILGIRLEKNTIQLTKIYAGTNKTSVEIIISQEIEIEQESQDNQKEVQALSDLVSKAGKFDQINVSIPSSMVVFKELNVPFSDPDKIKLIIETEIEQLLPFSPEEAILDFIKIADEEKNTKVLVCAVRIEDLKEVLKIYNEAGIEPDIITVDVLAIYNLYKKVPQYIEIKEATSIVDIGKSSTTITFIENGKLRLIRTVSKGFSDLKNLDQEKYLNNLFHDIQFSLNSFILKLNYSGKINKLIFTGHIEEPANLAEACTKFLQIPCEVFDINKLFSEKTLINNTSLNIDELKKFTNLIGLALPEDPTEEFNLRKKELRVPNNKLLTRQIYAAAALAAGVILTLIIWGYLQISGLKRTAYKLEESNVQMLKKLATRDYGSTQDRSIIQIMRKLSKDEKLAAVIKDIEGIIQIEESTWLSLTKLRLRPLEILDELTRTIDRNQFNITIDEVNIRISEEEGLPEVEVIGLLKPKVVGEDYKEFQKFEQSLTAQTGRPTGFTLVSTNPEPPLAQGGVRFSIVLTFKSRQ